jgi:hypothetical protein
MAQGSDGRYKGELGLMTSRERVLRTLNFAHPDRVPRDLWQLPVAQTEHGDAIGDLLDRWPTDFSGPAAGAKGVGELTSGDPFVPGLYRDEWGCVFENVHAGVMGQVKDPMLDDWSMIEQVRPPWEALDIDVDAVNRGCAASDRFVFAGCCPRPFERMQFIRGTENLMMDLLENPDQVQRLLDIVHDFHCRELEAWMKTAVDGITFMDDWGSQSSLLISPQQWRTLFKPVYAQYVRIAHDAGKKIFMHSDGCIFDIYEDLIEIGVDAINSQIFCMDIEQIGQRFAGRITFWGEIDRQHVLSRGTPAEARAAVQRVVSALHRPAGGVIAQFELGASARLEVAEAIFESWADLTGRDDSI